MSPTLKERVQSPTTGLTLRQRAGQVLRVNPAEQDAGQNFVRCLILGIQLAAWQLDQTDSRLLDCLTGKKSEMRSAPSPGG